MGGCWLLYNRALTTTIRYMLATALRLLSSSLLDGLYPLVADYDHTIRRYKTIPFDFTVGGQTRRVDPVAHANEPVCASICRAPADLASADYYVLHS